MDETLERIAGAIREAAARARPLQIRGGGSKDFYGEAPHGDVLDVRAYCGIVEYDPTELVITARCGTLLTELEQVLQEHGQMLGFEPPHLGETATLGGCIASGLSGPRRPYAGAARDFVLGVRLLDGTASDLRFGGKVIKNVAGYDVARLMVGALGTLGVLLEVSLKVLPMPRAELTLRMETPRAEAIVRMNDWAGKPLPVTATCHLDGHLYVRLSGAPPAVEAARAKIGGETLPEAARFWRALREHELEFFRRAGSLWRLSLKPTHDDVRVSSDQIIEWNGGLRWIASDADPSLMREAAAAAGGHATLFRGGSRSAVFQPLGPAMHALHERLKATFDPHGILNRGRLYPSF